MPSLCTMSNMFGADCNQKNGLNLFIMIKPEHPEKPDIKFACKKHTDDFIRECQYDENVIKNQIKLFVEDFKKHKVVSEKMEILGIDRKKREAKDNLDKKLRELRWEHCRYEDCRKIIKKEEYNYTVLILSMPRLKFRYAGYFHRNCFDKIRGRLGVKMPIHSGQHVLTT